MTSGNVICSPHMSKWNLSPCFSQSAKIFWTFSGPVGLYKMLVFLPYGLTWPNEFTSILQVVYTPHLSTCSLTVKVQNRPVWNQSSDSTPTYLTHANPFLIFIPNILENITSLTKQNHFLCRTSFGHPYSCKVGAPVYFRGKVSGWLFWNQHGFHMCMFLFIWGDLLKTRSIVCLLFLSHNNWLFTHCTSL